MSHRRSSPRASCPSSFLLCLLLAGPSLSLLLTAVDGNAGVGDYGCAMRGYEQARSYLCGQGDQGGRIFLRDDDAAALCAGGVKICVPLSRQSPAIACLDPCPFAATTTVVAAAARRRSPAALLSSLVDCHDLSGYEAYPESPGRRRREIARRWTHAEEVGAASLLDNPELPNMIRFAVQSSVTGPAGGNTSPCLAQTNPGSTRGPWRKEDALGRRHGRSVSGAGEDGAPDTTLAYPIDVFLPERAQRGGDGPGAVYYTDGGARRVEEILNLASRLGVVNAGA